VSERDHIRYEDDLAAYLLDALTESETREMERHIADCARCRERARWLQGSVEMLPMTVEQVEPPPELRERLMQTVRAEAAVGAREPVRRERAPRTGAARSLAERLLAIPRPALALGAVLLLMAGAFAGYVAGNADDSGTKEIQAQVAPAAQGARATLEVDGDRGILRVSGLPQHRNRIYEVWLAEGDRVRPAGLFQVDRQGRGAAGIPRGLKDADQVMVTLERTQGSARPTSDPLVIADT
jgi:anti-sigma-K factor RskA